MLNSFGFAWGSVHLTILAMLSLKLSQERRPYSLGSKGKTRTEEGWSEFEKKN